MYLQDEERLERRERIQLAKAQRGPCGKNISGRDGGGGGGGGSEKVEEKNGTAEAERRDRPAAAALGPCEDKSAESEAAAKVGRSVSQSHRGSQIESKSSELVVGCVHRSGGVEVLTGWDATRRGRTFVGEHVDDLDGWSLCRSSRKTEGHCLICRLVDLLWGWI